MTTKHFEVGDWVRWPQTGQVGQVTRVDTCSTGWPKDHAPKKGECYRPGYFYAVDIGGTSLYFGHLAKLEKVEEPTMTLPVSEPQPEVQPDPWNVPDAPTSAEAADMADAAKAEVTDVIAEADAAITVAFDAVGVLRQKRARALKTARAARSERRELLHRIEDQKETLARQLDLVVTRNATIAAQQAELVRAKTELVDLRRELSAARTIIATAPNYASTDSLDSPRHIDTRIPAAEHEAGMKRYRTENERLRQELAQAQQIAVLAVSRLAIVEPDVDGWKQARATLTKQFGTQFATTPDNKGHAVAHVIAEPPIEDEDGGTYAGVGLPDPRTARPKVNFTPPTRTLPQAG